MITRKKISIYDVNPRYFKDYSGNGTGDLKGLANKFDYFTYLGVDAIILQDILASHSKNSIKDYTSIDKEVGDINELVLVLSHAKKAGIKVFVEMKIGTISEGHNWESTAIIEKKREHKGNNWFRATKGFNTRTRVWSKI